MLDALVANASVGSIQRVDTQMRLPGAVLDTLLVPKVKALGTISESPEATSPLQKDYYIVENAEDSADSDKDSSENHSISSAEYANAKVRNIDDVDE